MRQLETEIARTATVLPADAALIEEDTSTVENRNKAIPHNNLIDTADARK